MAARKKLTHDDKTRQRIQTSQLVTRLMNHALGKNKMTQTQVRAAEILLKKTLPDLAIVDLKVSGGLDLNHKKDEIDFDAIQKRRQEISKAERVEH